METRYPRRRHMVLKVQSVIFHSDDVWSLQRHGSMRDNTYMAPDLVEACF